jgi:hypothetical protein
MDQAPEWSPQTSPESDRNRWCLLLDYLLLPRCYGRVYDAPGLHESGC